MLGENAGFPPIGWRRLIASPKLSKSDQYAYHDLPFVRLPNEKRANLGRIVLAPLYQKGNGFLLFFAQKSVPKANAMEHFWDIL